MEAEKTAQVLVISSERMVGYGLDQSQMFQKSGFGFLEVHNFLLIETVFLIKCISNRHKFNDYFTSYHQTRRRAHSL